MSRRAFPLSLTLALVGFLSPSAVMAQGMAPGLNNPVMDPGADIRKSEDNRRISEFMRIDSNGNGYVDAAEFAQFRTNRFGDLDRNDDNRLSRDEFVLLRLDRPQISAAQQFTNLDLDGNDFLSLVEFSTVSFVNDDVDGDGVLSLWEFRTRK